MRTPATVNTNSRMKEREWEGLPAGVLERIHSKAPTWQVPGLSHTSPVCRTWHAAAAAAAQAAGCRVTNRLFVAGYPATDKGFAPWLDRCGEHLEVLVFCSQDPDASNTLLGALADAAAAAKAAGRPLPMHTLRVLGAGPGLVVTGRLLASLPSLVCLQLEVQPPESNLEDGHTTEDMVAHLAPLKQATQLQQLYWTCSFQRGASAQEVADLLPASLVRLSWSPSGSWDAPQLPDLSALKALTFLQLGLWKSGAAPVASLLPPGLQQLEVVRSSFVPSQLQQQLEVLSGYSRLYLQDEQLEQLHSWTNLRCLSSVSPASLEQHRACAALQQLAQLSALGVDATEAGVASLQPVVSAASSLQGLRRLHIRVADLRRKPGQLAALMQLTHLQVSLHESFDEQWQRQMQQQQVLAMQQVLEQEHLFHMGGLHQQQLLLQQELQHLELRTPRPEVPERQQWRHKQQELLLQQLVQLRRRQQQLEHEYQLQQEEQQQQQQLEQERQELKQQQQQQQQLEGSHAWAAEVGRMSRLRWLSVPAVLLLGDQTWLGGLEQLQVLVLSGEKWSPGVTQQLLSDVVQWLGECDLQQLPPHLLLLGLTDMPVDQAAAWQASNSMKRRLSSRGCEVVVGADLDEVFDPAKQLAGVPVGLQQALA